MEGFLSWDDILSSPRRAGPTNSNQSAISQWGWGFHTVRAGKIRRATVFVPGCWSCTCMEGCVIRGWGLIIPGWRWLHDPQVWVSTPFGEVSTRGTTVFVPGLLELYMYGRISDPGMRPYPPRLALAPRTPANQRSCSGVGVSTPCRAVSTWGIAVFVPDSSEL